MAAAIDWHQDGDALHAMTTDREPNVILTVINVPTGAVGQQWVVYSVDPTNLVIVAGWALDQDTAKLAAQAYVDALPELVSP